MTDSVNYVISEANWDTNFKKVDNILLQTLYVTQYNKSGFEERNRCLKLSKVNGNMRIRDDSFITNPKFSEK